MKDRASTPEKSNDIRDGADTARHGKRHTAHGKRLDYSTVLVLTLILPDEVQFYM